MLKTLKKFRDLYIVGIALFGLSLWYSNGRLLFAITIFLVATIGLVTISESYIQKRIKQEVGTKWDRKIFQREKTRNERKH